MINDTWVCGRILVMHTKASQRKLLRILVQMISSSADGTPTRRPVSGEQGCVARLP